VNHINILEIPVFFTALHPRYIIGFSASKRWKVWWTRLLLNLADAIPLTIGEANIDAFRRGLNNIKDGNIILIAPEGTRSGHGRLQKGYPGVISLAMRSNAPLLPLVFYGHEHYKENLLRLKRTDFYFAVGKPFTLNLKDQRLTGAIRQQMVDEIMYQLASLLPAQNRGVYSNLDLATEEYLKFEDHTMRSES
jgi:1-acyl-sn-glycerol-3-phosphate acyltransferase